VEAYRLANDEDTCLDDNEKAQLHALEKISARIISFFAPSETLYIVIDKVGWCWHSTLNHRKALLDGLVKMVEVADCILVVITGYNWDSRKYDYQSLNINLPVWTLVGRFSFFNAAFTRSTSIRSDPEMYMSLFYTYMRGSRS
jgi:hypothetical protein